MGRLPMLGAVAAATALLAGWPQSNAASAVEELAFVRDDGTQTDIYLGSVDGGGARNLTANAAEDAGPAWSADGNRLAFASTRGGTWDIWVLTFPDLTLTQVTRGGGAEFDPSFSPDGKQIAYENTIKGRRDVYVVPSAGGTPVPVTTSGRMNLDPAWTAKGDEIYFESDRAKDRTFHIYATTLSGRVRQLTRGTADDFHPAASADGSKLAFERSDHGNYDLYVLDLKSGQLTRQSRDPEEQSEPTWGPDAVRVAFVDARNGQYEIYRVDTTTGKEVRVTQTDGADEFSPAWRPGTHAAVRATAVRHRAAVTMPCAGANLGTVNRDILPGSGFDDAICAKEGNDDLYGQAGADKLFGDPGFDLMDGGDGADRLYGGTNYAGKNPDRELGGNGNDFLYARGDKARDCVWGGDYGTDTGPNDTGRLDLGNKAWSDNFGAAPNRIPAWSPTKPCGNTPSIETLV